MKTKGQQQAFLQQKKNMAKKCYDKFMQRHQQRLNAIQQLQEQMQE